MHPSSLFPLSEPPERLSRDGNGCAASLSPTIDHALILGWLQHFPFPSQVFLPLRAWSKSS